MRLTITDAGGAPQPVTGAVAAQIRGARPDTSALADWTADLTDAATGVVLISLTGAQTAALVNGSGTFTGVWDVEWTPTGGQPITLLQGTVTCELDVTRS